MCQTYGKEVVMIRIACSFLLTTAVIMTFSIAFISDGDSAARFQKLASETETMALASLH